MQKLIKMQMDGMPSWNIQKQSITGTPDSKICFSTGDYYVAVVDVDQKSVISAVDKIVAVMARVAVPVGARVSAPTPWMRPLATAHSMASWA